jgi:hypothetical protein
MAVDKVKCLKIESPAGGGTQYDPFPTELNPTQDYSSMKGICFNHDDNFLLEHLGRAIVTKIPSGHSIKTYYLANGDVNYVEVFNSPTQIDANRIGRYDLAYNANLDPTSETLKIYDVDGTSILRTYTHTYTYTGFDITSTGVTLS